MMKITGVNKHNTVVYVYEVIEEMKLSNYGYVHHAYVVEGKADAWKVGDGFIRDIRGDYAEDIGGTERNMIRRSVKEGVIGTFMTKLYRIIDERRYKERMAKVDQILRDGGYLED